MTSAATAAHSFIFADFITAIVQLLWRRSAIRVGTLASDGKFGCTNKGRHYAASSVTAELPIRYSVSQRLCIRRKNGTPSRLATRMSGNFLVGIAVAVVFVVLLLGLYTLWVGGEVSRNWSNRLMRIRVLAQFIAVLIILAVLYFSGRY